MARMKQNPIIVALDVPAIDQALKLVDQLHGRVGAFKIGSELFTLGGPDIVRRVRSTGASVFLDLKFHDIPNTVAKAISSANVLDVQMLTVHASGGTKMLQAAEAAAQLRQPAPPLVLAVTVLTSFDSNELAGIGVQPNVGKQVERLANLAVAAKLRGLVCSPLEVVDLRSILPPEIQLVTPGIRTGPSGDDQMRTLSAREALAAGANWLVIGRPIYAARDPRAAADEILQSL
jgi:orotidine-5'-phosphate decarboxylase